MDVHSEGGTGMFGWKLPTVRCEPITCYWRQLNGRNEVYECFHQDRVG
jgi:hypothetical protein